MADKLADQISYLIAGSCWRLEAQIKAMAGPSPVPFEQWRVLALLMEQDGRPMSDLAQQAFLEPPTLTKMIDRMVADAFVYRAPDTADRRRVLIFLSDRGRARFRELQPAVQAQEKRATQRLGRADAASLRRILKELALVNARAEAVAGVEERRPQLMS